MKRLLLVLLLIFNSQFTSAQLGKEAWHWQFGQNISLDFSSGSPALGTSSMNASEGCASISDKNTGQLLFYTDGISVWTKNNTQMPNGSGLAADPSTTQAALIIPKPGSSNIYYIVTCDAFGLSNGVKYSVVDMALNGGLGDVVTKNTLLTPAPTTEKLTAVKHHNGIDYWIIDHPLNSNAFNAYLVTSSGVSTTPIISNIGTVINNISGAGVEGVGYLKASPDGKKLAIVVEVNFPILEIYDFNDSTAQITNPLTVHYSGQSNGSGPYGVSFSPDNTKIYTSDPDLGRLFQYDLSSGNILAITASQTVIDSSYVGCALQIAPDGKIYITTNTGNFAVINDPNNLGLLCNYKDSILNFGTKICHSGLPNFIDSDHSSITDINANFYNDAPIKVFPNPAASQFSIQTNSIDKFIIDVYDLNGKHLMNKTVNNKESIDIINLKEGVYTLTIKTINQAINKKLVIVR